MPHWKARLVPLLALIVFAWTHAPDAASRAPVRARHGMVASVSALASEAGVRILQQGGNAIDAAVAVGFALAVTHPEAGNLGGGGLMVIRFGDGRATTIDYRETAPAAAHRDMFLDEQGSPVADRSRIGPLAAGVPGSVAGLCFVHRKYGALPLAAVLAPAIDLAENGFLVSAALERSLAGAVPLLSRFPESMRVFAPDGRAPVEGDRLVQPDLARTLRHIATGGADAFYRGPIADLIDAEMRRSGGLIRKTDLAAYAPVEREPLRGTYRGHEIIAMPPISSGGIALIQSLNILEGFPIGELGHNSSKTMHLMAETMRRVYADRSEWLGDPAFFKVPVGGLISKSYAAALRKDIDPARATPSTAVKPGTPAAFESSQTTHYSVVDRSGTSVATTTTINGGYGNGQVVAGARNPDGSGFFALAFGVYPHLDIADASFSCIRNGVQHNLHASRELGMERMDLEVGPIRIEVIEPLRVLRVHVDGEGIKAELTFTGRAFPIEEPRFTFRNGPRTFMDYTRMTQNGHYAGWIEVDGERIALAQGCSGTRDRSWGVRPVGAADMQPHSASRPPCLAR